MKRIITILFLFTLLGLKPEAIRAISGNGSLATPYQIESVADLQEVANLVKSAIDFSKGKYFVVTQNIDVQNAVLSPIGNAAFPFMGNFDGGYKVISNFKINETGVEPAGFFGNLSGTVKNLGLENADVTSQYSSGALCGILNYGNYASADYPFPDVNNCYATGSVSSSNVSTVFAGGLVGTMFLGKITNSYSLCQVTSSVVAGGLVGVSQIPNYPYPITTPRFIQFCYADPASINADAYFGGFGGDITSVYIEDSFYIRPEGSDLEAFGNSDDSISVDGYTLPEINSALLNTWSEDNWIINQGQHPTIKGFSNAVSYRPSALPELYISTHSPRAGETVSIQLAEPGQLTLVLQDIQGRVVQMSRFTGQFSFNAPTGRGIYLLSLSGGNRTVHEKLVVR